MGASMAHDLLKIGLTLVVLALVIAAMALFVSGYLSAFKPGGKGGQTPAAVSGGRGGGVTVPSPSATVPPFPQYARPVPPGPVVQGPAQPAMPPEPGMMPPAGWPGPATAPSAPARAAPAVPVVPTAPGINSIIQVLFRLLPLIFHHQYGLGPVWPQLNP